MPVASCRARFRILITQEPRAGRRGRNVTVLNREIGRRPTALNGSFGSPRTAWTSETCAGLKSGLASSRVRAKVINTPRSRAL